MFLPELSLYLVSQVTEVKVLSLRSKSVSSQDHPLSLRFPACTASVRTGRQLGPQIPEAKRVSCRQTVPSLPGAPPHLGGTSYHDDISKLVLQEPLQLPPAQRGAAALRPGVAPEGFDDPRYVLQ